MRLTALKLDVRLGVYGIAVVEAKLIATGLQVGDVRFL